MVSTPPESRPRRKLLYYAPSLLIAWFPALIAFVVIPFDLYLPNQDDFSLNIAVVFPFLALSLVWFAVLILLVWRSTTFPHTFCVPLFCLGVFLALTDLILPVPQHVQSSSVHADPFLDIAFPVGIEVLIAVGLFIFGKKVSFEKIKTWAGAFVAVLLVAQVFTAADRLSRHTVIAAGGSVIHLFDTKAETHGTTGSRFNVYHITFDGLASAVFADAVSDGNIRSKLDGFTFFQNTRANYIWTNYSMPSYLTGTFYRKGSVETWTELRRTEGFLKDVTHAGYFLTMYVPTWFYSHSDAARQVKTLDVMSTEENPDSRIFGFSDFSDLWMARVIPHALWNLLKWGRNVTQAGSSAPSTPNEPKSLNRDDEVSRFLLTEESRSLHRTRWIRKIHDSLPLMRRFLSDEEKRLGQGQYVFLHTYISHEPHDVLDAECHVVGGKKPRDQAACSLKFLMDFIAKLKELGRYHRSAIILHADHGSSVVGPCNPGLLMPRHIIEDAVSVTHLPEDWLNNRTFPMLAIKPPDTSGIPMIVSQSPVQLADIPATVLEMLGIEGGRGVGRSVFTVGESEPRERHMFFGFARKNERGDMQWVGRQFFNGELSHISFINGKGYRKHPRIPFEWN